MTGGLRPNLALVTLVLEAVWLVLAIDAYSVEFGDQVESTAVAAAAIALIWAAPAIALCVVAWVVEQGLRVREAPPPPPVAPPPPQ